MRLRPIESLPARVGVDGAKNAKRLANDGWLRAPRTGIIAAMMGPADEINPTPPTEEKFFPRGAIFFFALLLLFYAAAWFVIYGLMIVRS